MKSEAPRIEISTGLFLYIININSLCFNILAILIYIGYTLIIMYDIQVAKMDYMDIQMASLQRFWRTVSF